MLKKIVVLTAILVGLSGCYMVPMALIGPASSGFTTASIIQSTVTTKEKWKFSLIKLKTNISSLRYNPKRVKHFIIVLKKEFGIFL